MTKVKKHHNASGSVAVIISPGFGAGWSTWADADERETMLFDADMVKALLKGDRVLFRNIADAKCPESYKGGSDDAEVQWVPKGRQFEVNEYDGSESLHIIGDGSYFTA